LEFVKPENFCAAPLKPQHCGALTALGIVDGDLALPVLPFLYRNAVNLLDRFRPAAASR
jgi:hypothetical protein